MNGKFAKFSQRGSINNSQKSKIQPHTEISHSQIANKKSWYIHFTSGSNQHNDNTPATLHIKIIVVQQIKQCIYNPEHKYESAYKLSSSTFTHFREVPTETQSIQNIANSTNQIDHCRVEMVPGLACIEYQEVEQLSLGRKSLILQPCHCQRILQYLQCLSSPTCSSLCYYLRK